VQTQTLCLQDGLSEYSLPHLWPLLSCPCLATTKPGVALTKSNLKVVILVKHLAVVTRHLAVALRHLAVVPKHLAVVPRRLAVVPQALDMEHKVVAVMVKVGGMVVKVAVVAATTKAEVKLPVMVDHKGFCMVLSILKSERKLSPTVLHILYNSVHSL